jgi:hypothetical protein
MTSDDLDKRFAAYLARDDDALTGSRFFEILSEIERRRTREPIEVRLRVINGQAYFEPSDQVRVQGNELWVGDHRVVITVTE